MSGPIIEIVMPVRNPGEPLRDSVDSLLAQTDRGFTVLLSDNQTSKGADLLEAARAALIAGGVTVRLVRTPFELGRVEHWNWSHHQSTGDWIKPLFVGDMLKPEYIACLRKRIIENPAARVARCRFEIAYPDRVEDLGELPFPDERLAPGELLRHYPGRGNWLGGPINFAFERSAWRASGGYPTQLPVAADLCLYAGLALRHGIELLPEKLATFQLHNQRFTHGLRDRRVDLTFELWMILSTLRNYCLETGLPWPRWGIVAAVWEQWKHEYWYPFRKRVKHALFGQPPK